MFYSTIQFDVENVFFIVFVLIFFFFKIITKINEFQKYFKWNRKMKNVFKWIRLWKYIQRRFSIDDKNNELCCIVLRTIVNDNLYHDIKNANVVMNVWKKIIKICKFKKFNALMIIYNKFEFFKKKFALISMNINSNFETSLTNSSFIHSIQKWMKIDLFTNILRIFQNSFVFSLIVEFRNMNFSTIIKKMISNTFFRTLFIHIKFNILIFLKLRLSTIMILFFWLSILFQILSNRFNKMLFSNTSKLSFKKLNDTIIFKNFITILSNASLNIFILSLLNKFEKKKTTQTQKSIT